MKIILLIAFIGHYETVTPIQYEMSSITECQETAENLKDIFAIDPAFRRIEVSLNCLRIPR